MARGSRKIASLAEYRRKRDFKRTREPKGGARAASRLYIVQKHAASRLHYDFRLELDGTLKSWAVPKGPSVQPGSKRLAVHVEDHPVEYGSFEGIIPEGEYGGGTVMLWDRGTWEPIGDARASYRKGRLKFRLHGERLTGIWNLVRMGGAAGENGKNWLLIKDRDDGASKKETTERETTSVASGRSMDDIRKNRPRVWKSKGGEEPRLGPEDLPGARRGRPTESFAPQLATLAQHVPEGEGWIHEVKLDGYRILAFVSGKRVRLMSRNGKDWTAQFADVAAAVRELGVDEAVLDGEVVVLRPNGVSDFQALQNRMRAGRGAKIVYSVFDLPYYGGCDLRSVPLLERKSFLRSVIGTPANGTVRYADHIKGKGTAFLEQACKLGTEGIVSKRADAPYLSKRAPSWLKIKCSGRQELVIGGWTDPQGTRTGFGSLLLGTYGEEGELVYAGKVGTGFGEALRHDLMKRFAKIGASRSPFAGKLPAVARRAHWVKPVLVAEVRFTEWTSDGRLRHPAFLGLREDKLAGEVVRESGATRLTHADRVFWPEGKITKADLASYYREIADLILPHLVGRRLAIVRCPEGYRGGCFFQKHSERGAKDDLGIKNLEDLIGLVQIGALELHPWGSSAPSPERPDRLIFDLDPDPGVPWRDVIATAVFLRRRLEQDGLRSFAKTSGGKGLHVVAPLSPIAGWEQVKAYARTIAFELVRAAPDRYVAVSTKAKREGRIFVDWQRNARGATAIASYSTRARAEAPIATPVTWRELQDVPSGDAFHMKDILRRARKSDPWDGFFALAQSLPKPRARAGAR